MSNKSHSIVDLIQNVVTYFIAIYASSCVDLILKLLDKTVSYRKLAIILIIFSVVGVLVLTIYILHWNSASNFPWLIKWLAIGVAVSWLIWWLAHYSDDAFNPNGALGGTTQKKLSNG